MTILDLLSVCGFLLGLGAALDFALKADFKQRFSRWLTGLTVPNGQTPYKGFGAVQKVFGDRFFSLRAITVAVFLSLVSITFSYIFAVLTSDREAVDIFTYDPSGLAIAIFAICLIGSLLGDIFSYAQTRLFLKTVDQQQNWTVSIGLALADIIISLSIFIFLFSLARFLSYLLVITAGSPEMLSKTQIYDVNAGKAAIQKYVDDGTFDERELEWPRAIVATRTKRDQESIRKSLVYYAAVVSGSEEKASRIDYSTEVRCAVSYDGDVYQSVSDTAELLVQNVAASRQENPETTQYRDLLRDVQKEIANTTPGDGKCPYRLLTIKSSISAKGLIGIAGLTNSYLGSFERTLDDFQMTFGFKLAPYINMNPFADLQIYINSVIAQSENVLLGIGVPDPAASILLDGVRVSAEEKRDSIQVPFSPMLASCLTVSALFWAYLGFLYTARLSSFLRYGTQKLLPAIDLKNAVFTSVGIAISVIILTVMVLGQLTSFIWLLLF